MKRDDKGVAIDGGKTYTANDMNAKGVVFFDGVGKEVSRHYFKKGKPSNTFTAPKDSIGFKFIAPN